MRTQTIGDAKNIRPSIRYKPRHGWSPERRARQSAAIRRWQPWMKSTGPRTALGKARIRYNAQVHGNRNAAMREFLQVLAAQRRYARAALLFSELGINPPAAIMRHLVYPPKASLPPRSRLG